MKSYLAWEKKFLGNFKKRPLSWALILAGFILIIFGSTNYFRIRRLSFNGTPQLAQNSGENLEMPVELIIPSLSLNLKVDPGVILDGIWQVSNQNATYLTTSAPPGQNGNTVIYGHNLKRILGNLPYISDGQKITIKTMSGKLLNYTVISKVIVSPDRIDLVSPTSTEELTIYTCTGFADTKRVVVKAKPIE
jgi:LPXTG-site transpeptidase (sortase) family protein